MLFCRDADEIFYWWQYLNFAANVMITWTVIMDQIKWISEKKHSTLIWARSLKMLLPYRYKVFLNFSNSLWIIAFTI